MRALLSADDSGEMQIIAPELSILDFDPVTESTSRQLRPVFKTNNNVCAIPGYYDTPCVVHTNLNEPRDWALATETPGRFVRLNGSDISRLSSSHTSFTVDFCEDLTVPDEDISGDETRIYDAVENFTTKRIQSRLEETLQIPPLPAAAQQMIALQRNPNYDLTDLVRIVEMDSAMAARIMGWANSAFYGNGTPSGSLQDAIMRVLGFDLVFNMALGLAIGATLKLPKSHVQGTAPFWVTSVYKAAAMEGLARQTGDKLNADPGTAYLIGLLSNFGSLVLGHVFPPQYEHICRLQEANSHLHHTAIDYYVLSLTRETIAASLLQSWELPDYITTAVRFQHAENYEGEHATYVSLLNLCGRLLDQNLLKRGPLTVSEEHYSQAASLGLSRESLDEVVNALSEAQDEFWSLAQTWSTNG